MFGRIDNEWIDKLAQEARLLGVARMLRDEEASAGGGEEVEDLAEGVERAAGLLEGEAESAGEDGLGDSLVDELGVLLHQPVDVDLEPAAVQVVGQPHVADDRALVGAGGEGEEGEDRLGHGGRD